MEEKNVFKSASKKISIKLLDTIIILGILAMALLIPYLAYKGGFSFDGSGEPSSAEEML